MPVLCFANIFCTKLLEVELELRLLNETHIADLVEMESDSNTSEFIIPYNNEKHFYEMKSLSNKYLGIYESEELLGFIILGIEEDGKRIEFRRIVIKHKGLGIGQKAVMKLEEYCRAAWNTKSVWLDVFEFNHRGIHIYEKLGYKKIGSNFFNEKRLIIMEKHL